MNWSVLDALETKHSAINAILVVELDSLRVVMANTLALEYFARRDNNISLQRTLGADTNLKDLFQSVQDDLGEKLETVMEDATLERNIGDELECDLTFTYASPEKKHVFLKIHPNFDNRPYYLEKFIESRPRPAFTLNLNANLSINHGNAKFFQAFACNKTSMKLRYKNYFGNLLAEEFRSEYEALIFGGVNRAPYGRLEIPVQTAQGESLWFYYDTLRLRKLEEDFHNNLFCLLVNKEDTHEDLNNPFHNY